MEMKSPLSCPYTVTVRRNPHRKARPTPATNAPPIPNSQPNFGDIPSFPIDDILSIEIPQEPEPNPPQSSSESTLSENLKVFLRIRPLKPLQSLGKAADSKSRTKNAWPQNPQKKNTTKEKKSSKKSDSCCIVVNDSRSITLSPPLSLQDTKKLRSEMYEGFSHVFSADSSQGEVYERMVNPLVEDFLAGKSGMLAALGPSGSGKTHTVFGCPREPGMVPLILRRIFRQIEGSQSESPRKFYISMFEIHSERGKGEKISDLFSDGGDVIMQQSTIKGLQESSISHVAEAESLIAQGMLRRATAMTNTNSQSSRSQCIINIRWAPEVFDEEVNAKSESALLTIVDLAGAEREKRTGNQGARLLESNFINNTSMVFGLCLRSLLEHQKNPKKQLQKHFQNSLLTKYLRDYLEGKKRMTLILTVKSGEEDYLDTSFLLRQASPFMKIKFNLVDKPSTSRSNKRQFEMFPRSEQHKRVKVNGVDVCEIEEGKSAGTDCQLKKGEPVSVLFQSSEVLKANTPYISPSSSDCNLENMERTNQIMQNFAKALWSVLKEYKKKLEVAESEVYSLRIEKARYTELERELSDLKSRCSCSKGISVVGASDKMNTKAESRINNSPAKGDAFSNCHESNVDTHSPNDDASECIGPLRKWDSPIRNDQHIHLQGESSDVIDPFNKVSELHNDQVSPNLMGSYCGESEKRSDVSVRSPDFGDDTCLCVTDYNQQCNQENVDTHYPKDGASECSGTSTIYNFRVESDQDVLLEVETSDVVVVGPNRLCVGDLNLQIDQVVEGAFCSVGYSCGDNEQQSNPTEGSPYVDNASGDRLDRFDQQIQYTNQRHGSFPRNSEDAQDFDEFKTLGIEDNCSEEKGTGSSLCDVVVSSVQSLEISDVGQHTSTEQEGEGFTQESTSCQPLSVEKPKRKLLPASSVLLRDVSCLDFNDENERPKGNRGEKKLAANERHRTQGSVSLLRLLKSNLHQ